MIRKKGTWPTPEELAAMTPHMRRVYERRAKARDPDYLRHIRKNYERARLEQQQSDPAPAAEVAETPAAEGPAANPRRGTFARRRLGPPPRQPGL